MKLTYLPPKIHPTAEVIDPELIGDGSVIKRGAELDAGVSIGVNTIVGREVCIGTGSDVGSDVVIGPRVRIGRKTLIMDSVIICPNNVKSVSSDGRKIGNRNSIGFGVLLHDEVELADEAIVPTQRTIVSIGNLGVKNRVVTIYGSGHGVPLYSIGCQVGVRFERIEANIARQANTTLESASTYTPFLPTFLEIGAVVQRAYEQESNAIEELLAARREYGLS